MIRFKKNPINASSMADIAFLLLIFFLVTTTMEQEEGIKALLPPPDSGETSPRSQDYVVAISMNGKGDILLDNESSSIVAVKKRVREFYVNQGTQHRLIQIASCKDSLKNRDLNEKEEELWKWRLRAAELNNGSYYELRSSASIVLECSPSVTYDKYIELQDAIHSEVKKLRRKWCKSKGYKPYDLLNPSIPEERDLIRTLRLMYPIRIQDVEFQLDQISDS